MKQYDKIYTVSETEDQELSAFRNMGLDAADYAFDLEEHSNVIVLTEDELLDLMQQSVERAHTTLLREKASQLLNATLKYQR